MLEPASGLAEKWWAEAVAVIPKVNKAARIIFFIFYLFFLEVQPVKQVVNLCPVNETKSGPFD